VGASVYYHPLVPQADKHLPVGPTSTFITEMQTEFGDQPWKLDLSHIAALWEVAKRLDDIGVYRAVGTLTTEIMNVGPIQVDVVY
jgi:hypothetical protein